MEDETPELKSYQALPVSHEDGNCTDPHVEDITGVRRRFQSTSMPPQDLSACLAMAKAIQILGGQELTGVCGVEKCSVYGTAIALPQIGRSARWPKTMCILTMRAYLFVTINYIVQTLFIYYIYDSQTNMNAFGSQMHLCDFAANIHRCPGSPNCHGPGGKEIPNPGELYPFDIWNTRKFLRDSLLVVFPDRRDEIIDKVDPGEYGTESYSCRLLCIFIFMIAIADEFQNIRDLLKLLRHLPSEEGTWVEYDPPQWADKAHVKEVRGIGELNMVRFKVSGMPYRWKVFNVIFILIPKIFIWRMLTMAGVHFLMETAAMVDLIVNTTALTFVFAMDELLLERLTTKATRHIMASLEDYELYDHAEYESETDQAALNKYVHSEMYWRFTSADWWLLPRRLFWSLVLMAFFVIEYYWHNCTRMEDGSWVSIDMFLPKTAHLEWFCFVRKFFSELAECPGPEEEPGGASAFWTMPT